MTTKFSATRPAAQKPAFCKAPPPPPLIPVPPGFPATLSAWVQWRDWDPLAPGEQRAVITLNKVAETPIYQGCSPLTGDRTCLTVSAVPPTGWWNILLECYDQYRTPDAINMGTVWVDPAKHFDTGILTDVCISGIDFRYVQVTD